MKKEEGFSLIELLVVVAILGIISAIAVPQLLNARKAAQEANAIRYLRSWSSGQEMYRRVNGTYSTTDEELVTQGFINKGLNGGGNADDTGYFYSIDSDASDFPRWWGRARRKSSMVATRSFYIDQTGVIRARLGNTANSTDPAIE